MGGGGPSRGRARPPQGGGPFSEEGTAMTAFPAIIGLHPKSGGGGEGGRPFSVLFYVWVFNTVVILGW